MRKLALVVLFLAFFATPCFGQLAMTWDNWVYPNWAPSGTYDPNWMPVNPATLGYTKFTFASTSDPEYLYRYKHYYYSSNATPGFGYACGPEAYLKAAGLCERNPFYWNYVVASSTCVPDAIYNGARIRCEVSTPNAQCCYRTNAGDLLNFGRIAPVYPPGSLNWA